MSGVRHIHNLTIHLNWNDKTLLFQGWRPSLVRAGRPHTAQLSGLPTGWRDACLTFPCFTMFYSCIYSCMMVLVAPCRLLPKSVDTHLSLTKSPMLFSETSWCPTKCAGRLLCMCRMIEAAETSQPQEELRSSQGQWFQDVSGISWHHCTHGNVVVDSGHALYMYFTMFLLDMFSETTSHSLVYSLQTKSERLCWWDQEAAEWELKSSWNSQDQIES